jgi:hypothetical protein
MCYFGNHVWAAKADQPPKVGRPHRDRKAQRRRKSGK